MSKNVVTLKSRSEVTQGQMLCRCDGRLCMVSY